MAQARPDSKRKAGSKAGAKARAKPRGKAPQKSQKNGGVKRDANGKFLPGTAAANPGGRPKAEHSVVELARTHTELAIRTLVEIAGDSGAPAAARSSAAAHLLDRGWGRPRQALEHSGPGGVDLPPAIMVTLVRPSEADE